MSARRWTRFLSALLLLLAAFPAGAVGRCAPPPKVAEKPVCGMACCAPGATHSCCGSKAGAPDRGQHAAPVCQWTSPAPDVDLSREAALPNLVAAVLPSRPVVPTFARVAPVPGVTLSDPGPPPRVPPKPHPSRAPPTV